MSINYLYFNSCFMDLIYVHISLEENLTAYVK